MKKWIMVFLALAVVFSFGLAIQDAADAKGYKSGKKSFSPTQSNHQINSTPTKPDAGSSVLPSSKPMTSTPGSGGFMKGLLYGGLAGLLFGSLFGNLGFLGAILGFLVNLLAVIAVVAIVIRLYTFIKDQRRKREFHNAWKR